MKTRLLACSTTLLALLPAVASAHPGHDGHELVWDYSGGHVHLEPFIAVLAMAMIVVAVRASRRRG